MTSSVRLSRPEDREALWNLRLAVESETSFMIAGSGERESKPPDRSFGYIARDDSGPIGFIDVRVPPFSRASRRGYIVMGVLQSHTGQGHGRALLEEAIREARRRNLRRLELTVQTRNTVAVSLYRSCGLEVEGLRRAATEIDGADVDEYYMGLLLNGRCQDPTAMDESVPS